MTTLSNGALSGQGQTSRGLADAIQTSGTSSTSSRIRRSLVPESIMPQYGFLAEAELKISRS